MNLDSRQLEVKNELDGLSRALENQNRRRFFANFLQPKNQIKSLYIHGGVGRGKTMLMKIFFDSLEKTPKFYIHFNSFMRKIHEALRDIRREEKTYKDELIEAVNRVVGDVKLICFDEFQVVDIADAMLLARIFSYLFSKEVVAVFTSNTAPLDLYREGLQREIFLDFVRNILLKNSKILHLDSETDYRAKRRSGLAKRYFVSNKKNREEFKKIIENIGGGKKFLSKKIKVWGREIKLKKTHERILVTSFEELCNQPLAASDYQEICRNFDLIFFKNLPILTQDHRNEMRRFMFFIDEVYERKIGLVILAKTTIKNICTDHLFKRTASRLKEIRSDDYFTQIGYFFETNKKGADQNKSAPFVDSE